MVLALQARNTVWELEDPFLIIIIVMR